MEPGTTSADAIAEKTHPTLDVLLCELESLGSAGSLECETRAALATYHLVVKSVLSFDVPEQLPGNRQRRDKRAALLESAASSSFYGPSMGWCRQ